ncbi:MAG: signal peptidase I [Gammaproteobacteria bacterium]|jgi:signal peptidase I|nr:signal peptidase I [Gammaproteobacteria bacterium]MBT4605519.1 signal peptidase I [Thiotrichales bacterium]MBT3968332.1 signal peptidase I [Gammaproteobacteria bacterium]MBT4079778.1 signal peptidase I [Gammaproteobacteria bacterium]MBT4330765.1 signal peptidase I [Gammaproteobacteria bacterium]
MHLDFSGILLIALVVTGSIWALDAKFWAQNRFNDDEMPILVEYARSFFPVILIVLVLRSFLFEPFRIPSSSMRPTLVVGDFILVNKFTYGLRLPVIDTKIFSLNDPQRGDVMVFRYPENPSIDYIKRVVGVPGDRIEYRNRRVFVNGKAAEMTKHGTHLWMNNQCQTIDSLRFREQTDDTDHEILIIPRRASRAEGEWVVPEGHYFMLGDNRDNSRDGRYWGFVPEENIVGKAVAVWMSWDFNCGDGISWGRIGGID